MAVAFDRVVQILFSQRLLSTAVWIYGYAATASVQRINKSGRLQPLLSVHSMQVDTGSLCS